MKKILLFVWILFLSNACFSQLNAAFNEDDAVKDSISRERDKKNDQTIYIAVNINSINATASNNITFSIDASQSSAGVYSFQNTNAIAASGFTDYQLPVTIMHGDNGGSNKYIAMEMTYTDGNKTIIKSLVIKVTDKADPKPVTEKPDIKSVQEDKIMFLNAYNFDFGSASLNSNYVGHLNLFAPSLDNKDKKTGKKSGRWGWGFNTGIMKINYGQKDTSNSDEVPVRENVFIHPLDTLAEGIKYLRQINNYKTERRNTVWSFYVQPLLELTKSDGDQHIYAHAHLELLATNWTSTTTVSSSATDTAIYTNPAPPGFVIRSQVAASSTYSVKSLSGYFGVGLTFNLKPWDGGNFFFQPTIGITSNRPSPSSLDINANNAYGLKVKSPTDDRTWHNFYLVRANYLHVLSKDATIIVGMDIRGLFPLYNPQYAAYIGLNLSLESVVSLIGGSKKTPE